MKGFLASALVGAFIFGWLMNIVELFTATAITGMEVARGIGIFVAPLGSILGYF